MNESIVLTLSPHSSWGYILQPVVVSMEKEGWLTILETATSKNPMLPTCNEATSEIMQLSEKYSDKVLMKNYSREKTVSDFLKNVKQDTIEKFIRPCIENYQQKIIRQLPASGMPLYLRKSIKDKTLHNVDLVRISDKPASAIFYFIKDSSGGLRYSIRIQKSDGAEIDLYKQAGYTLCQNPAILVIGENLLFFKDIDQKKLLPFFTKEYVNVPPSSINTYLKTFVSKCLIHYTVRSEGLDIREITPQKKAELVLERDWNNIPVLNLTFRYNQKKLSIDHPNKKIVWTNETEAEPSLTWFYPDKQWELHTIQMLTKNGLKQTNLSHFSINTDTPSYENENIFGMIDWIREHSDVLQHFDFEQQLAGIRYYTGEIGIRSEVIENIDWFDLHCVVLFGELQVPFVLFRQHILDNVREYVLPDGSIAILPLEWLSKYYELALFGRKNGETLRIMKTHFRLLEIMPEPNTTTNNLEEFRLLPPPPGLNTTLRPYQQAGYSWLVHLNENRFGGCLADDMGLGKTLQTIALLLHQKNKTKQQPTFETGSSETLPTTLIVMPTSLLHNWRNEIARFAPTLRTLLYSGMKRVRSNEIDKIFRHYDVVLTTYGTLRNDIEYFQSCQFKHLILDESQYTKNPESQSHQSVKQIQAEHTIALTGTPVENSLTDLWALFNIVNEGFLGNLTSFRKAYLNPIKKNSEEKEAALLRLIRPFILRRTKEAVAPELPPLMEETVYCDMNEQQANRYLQEKNKLRNLLSEMESKIIPSNMAFNALQGLTRLRLLANHPVLLENDYQGDSGKFEQILMRLDTLTEGNHKVLIFSSFVKNLRILASQLEQKNYQYAWLTGSTAMAEREEEIRRFTQNPDIHCFLISLKAGGVGLNLTAADYVFILDPWWNSAAEMQAISRAHRIGQEKNIIVYRFIASNTIEEKIRRLQESKAQLAETFVGANNPLLRMTKQELEDLLTEEETILPETLQQD